MKHISLTNFIVFVVLFVCPTFVCGQGENINLVNETVYINHVDSKFHREYCKELVFTKRPIKVKDALLKKYIPCDVCGASIRYIDIDKDKDKDKFIFEEAKQETIIFREDADLFRPDIPEYCPYKYFTNPLPKFASFYALRTLIQKHGKLTVFNTTRRLSNSIVTIRVGDDFKEFLGTPDQKYVDECTIMFDLISLRLSSDETERQLLAFKAEERKKEEYRLEAERRIAEEKQKGEETRRLEEEKKLQEKKQNEEKFAKSKNKYKGSQGYNYDPNPFSRPCREACSYFFPPGTTDYRICVSSCSN